MATWGCYGVEYRDPWEQSKNSIEVIKGTPKTAMYAIFYAVEEDPVIFCRTKEAKDKALKKLHKRDDVDQKSIRVFKVLKEM